MEIRAKRSVAVHAEALQRQRESALRSREAISRGIQERIEENTLKTDATLKAITEPQAVRFRGVG